MRTPLPSSLLAAALLAAAPLAAHAQHEGHEGMHADTTRAPRRAVHVMAQAIPLVTRATGTGDRAQHTEAALSQPLLMVRGGWRDGALALDAALNGEGATIRDGELSTGAFGEGFVDRRHPHAWVHEVMLTGRAARGPLAWSASAGRGFVPFGTDDPMMRPFEKYPINHHLAQVLERIQVVGALRAGNVILEGSSFAGDEPSSPSSAPSWSRLGDSWSVRGTLLPTAGSELQASWARVASPEQPSGFGLDQRKRSISGRMVGDGGARYLLAEWARTVERDHTRQLDAFAYETALVEGSAAAGPMALSVRLEQTQRPEEERLADPFRTPRPASDLAIAGLSRWRTVTVALAATSPIGGILRSYPFVEVERLAVRTVDPRSLFSVSRFYASDRLWMVTAGVRLRFGDMHARMGRYGAALPSNPALVALGAAAGAAHSH
jgi:hypothetical protein